MRIVFAGTPEFALPSLNALVQSHEVAAVLTAPDARGARGRTPVAPPVKKRARELGLNVWQPKALDRDFFNQVAADGSDILVVVAYGKIFKPQFIDIFSEKAVNVHPSLLPLHRGPTPIPATILAGETHAGVTVQYLAQKVDSGPVLAQQEVELTGRETTPLLAQKLAELGAGLLLDVLAQITDRKQHPREQDEARASYCRLLTKQDGLIDWRKSAAEIERAFRAFMPWPGLFTGLRQNRLLLTRVAVHSQDTVLADKKPGQVLAVDKKAGILVQTGLGVLALQELKPQFKKAVSAADFGRSEKDLVDQILGENL